MFLNLKIVIVDDEEINIILLEELVKQAGYTDCTSFYNPLKALDYLEENSCDILIVDFNMPDMDGVELLQKAKGLHPDMLSIMITASSDESVMIRALETGVNEFLRKPISGIVFKLRLKNISQLKDSFNITHEFNKTLQKRVDDTTSALRQSEYEALEVLSKSAEYKDPETASHIARVSHYAKLIAQKIGLSEEEQKILYFAAPLHDIGKIGIEDSILLKPGKLTPEEFDTMKNHSQIGATILENRTNVYLKAGQIIALTHHEKFNGKGYPKGLKGEEIPLYGRIVAIADVFDALTSIRPYKKAWTFEDATKLLIEERDEHFDPELVNVFTDALDEVQVIFEKFQEG